MSEPKYDYIATAPCGCTVGAIAVINGNEKNMANDIAYFIRNGCRVESVERDSDKFRDALANFGHHCQDKQMALFSEEDHD